jgi:hypothetical protein
LNFFFHRYHKLQSRSPTPTNQYMVRFIFLIFTLHYVECLSYFCFSDRSSEG